MKIRFYLFIPMSCMLFWILFSLMVFDFTLPYDFIAYYLGGKNIFTNPELLYSEHISPPFIYFPSIASILSVLSLFPFDIAKWIFFFILILFAESNLIIFDEILDIKNVQNKSLRFLMLFSMSNGFVIMEVFNLLQMKYISIFLILLFLKRELVRKRMEIQDFQFKFYLIQTILLLFAVMIIPYIFFLIPIYIFHKVSFKEIFTSIQLKKYLIFGIIFLSTNFMFFIEPSLLIRFLSLASKSTTFRLPFFSISNFPNALTPSIITENRIHFSRDLITNILILIKIVFEIFDPSLDIALNVIYALGGVLTLLLLSIATIILTCKKMEIEKKFGYFAIFTLFTCIYYYYPFYVSILPLIVILFTAEKKKINKFIIIGLFCVFLLYSLPPAFIVFKFIPFLAFLPPSLIIFRQNIIYVILLIALNFNIKINKETASIIDSLGNGNNFTIISSEDDD